MKVAIPVWQGNVSNVFDFAQRLLLVELKNRAEVGRQELALSEQSAPERVGRLRQLGVNVLICGAISRPLAYMLSGSGIQVLPFVAGSAEQILAAYRAGQLSLPQYALPRCWEGARRGFRRSRTRGRRRW